MDLPLRRADAESVDAEDALKTATSFFHPDRLAGRGATRLAKFRSATLSRD
jgi:hypothetical protein